MTIGAFLYKIERITVMFTFLLIGSLSQRHDLRAIVDKLGVVRHERGDRYIAHAPAGMQDGWIAIQQVENAEADFDVEELALVKEFIADPCFFVIEGRDGVVNFSDKFILGLDCGEDLLIDNDHGLIENVKGVQRRIQSGVNWLDAGH
jgi:hypothetical protein